MPSERHRTHRLECEGFAAEFRALLDRIVADTTAAIVWLREDEQRIEPDGTDCRRTWTAVRDRFERVPERDRDEATAWRVSTTTERDREALFDLVALTDGVAGAHFVYRLTLHADGTPVLEAIPHHAAAEIDATLVGADIHPGEIVGLEGHDACVVPTETRFEWVAEDRRWKIRGGSLCVEALDGRQASCYGLTTLERATRIDDGTVLALAWEPGELSDDVVGKFLSWIMTKLYRPPTAVPCETVDRATAIRAYLQELLAAYDGRTI